MKTTPTPELMLKAASLTLLIKQAVYEAVKEYPVEGEAEIEAEAVSDILYQRAREIYFTPEMLAV